MARPRDAQPLSKINPAAATAATANPWNICFLFSVFANELIKEFCCQQPSNDSARRYKGLARISFAQRFFMPETNISKDNLANYEAVGAIRPKCYFSCRVSATQMRTVIQSVSVRQLRLRFQP